MFLVPIAMFLDCFSSLDGPPGTTKAEDPKGPDKRQENYVT